MKNNIWKSIGAILAGFITVFVLSIGMDMLMEGIGVFPTQANASQYQAWMLLVALIYRIFISIFGFYVTAKLAPANPLQHALTLGVLGTVFAILGAIGNWHLMDPSMAWYPVLLVLVTLPTAWLGGKLAMKKKSKKK